jgi:outer membrane lipoprotein-sorting protein
MTNWTEADARSSLRPEEAVDGTPSHVVELAPQRDDIGYKKIVVWLGKADLVPRQLEFWEGGSEPKKRLKQSEVRSIGPIPVAHRVEVATPAAGSRTVIEIADVKFDQKVDPDLFTQRYLELGAP